VNKKKIPVVDYKQFSFKKINEPQFEHLKFLLGWIGYFALYFITENFIPRDNCYPVHCWLDDVIPFCEVFVIFYVGWYVLIVVSLIYFALYNPDNFKKLMTFIIVTQVVAMFIYIVFPSRQDLRPETFTRNNVFTWIMEIIYSADTSTNVCPSLHVAYSIGIASTWLKEKSASVGAKAFTVIFCILVCLSTAFVKQHSVVDGLVAIPMCIFAEFIAFGKYWKEKFLLTKK